MHPVDVSVNASAAPGSTVWLVIQYDNGQPSSTTTDQQTIDNNGNATIQWNVQVTRLGPGKTVTAHVTAMVKDPQGNQASSQSTSVLVTG
jgi:hypothetical protein